MTMIHPVRLGSLPLNRQHCTTCQYYTHDCALGAGNINAVAMIVGDTPDSSSANQHVAFSGGEGTTLSSLFAAVGLNTQSFYKTNVVKCDPGFNADGPIDPPVEVSTHCLTHLKEELARLKPKTVLALGDEALKAFLPTASIDDFRGMPFKAKAILPNTTNPGNTFEHTFKIVPALHPRNLSTQWTQEHIMLRDLVLFRKELLSEQVLEPAPVQYHVVKTIRDFKYFLQLCKRASLAAFDSETTSLDYRNGKVLCWSFSFEHGKAWVVPLYSIHSYLWDDVSRTYICEGLREEFFENPQIAKCGANVPFDIQWVWNQGSGLTNYINDVLYSGHLLNENIRWSLKLAAQLYTDLGHYDREVDLYTGGKKNVSYEVIPNEVLWRYAATDADATRRVSLIQLEELEKEGVLNLSQETCIPLGLLTAKMRRIGIYIDKDKLIELDTYATNRMIELKAKLVELVGHDFNPNATKDLQQIFFAEKGYTPLKQNKTGPSTDAETLKHLVTTQQSPEAEIMLDMRGLGKLKGTYLGGGAKGDTGILHLVDENNRLHAEFRVDGTDTGRLSCSNPNLQNIPRKRDKGEVAALPIRSIFAAPKGKILVCADFERSELVTMAYEANDLNLQKACRNGDPHAEVAKSIFKEKFDPKSKDQRNTAKCLNFGIPYGRGPESVAEVLHCDEAQAQKYLDDWFAVYFGVQNWIQGIHRKVITDGGHFIIENDIVKLRGGLVGPSKRKRRFYGFHRVGKKTTSNKGYKPKKVRLNAMQSAMLRSAQNCPIQSGSSDRLSVAAIIIDKEVCNVFPETFLVNLVHDAVQVETPVEYGEAVAAKVKEIMEYELMGYSIGADTELTERWG